MKYVFVSCEWLGLSFSGSWNSYEGRRRGSLGASENDIMKESSGCRNPVLCVAKDKELWPSLIADASIVTLQ